MHLIALIFNSSGRRTTGKPTTLIDLTYMINFRDSDTQMKEYLNKYRKLPKQSYAKNSLRFD
jgi:hypothetical protein